MQYLRRAGFGNVSSVASVGESGMRETLRPSKVNPAFVLLMFVILIEHEHDYEHEPASIGMLQHRVLERAFAIAVLTVVPVIGLQVALQF